MAQAGGEPGPAGTSKVPVPPNAFYVPSPVVLLSTLTRSGKVDVSTMSAVGVACLDPPIVAVGIKPGRSSYRHIRQSGAFVINLPLERDLWASDYLGTRKFRNQPDKVAACGLVIERFPDSGLPYVASCPIVMACSLVGTLGRHEIGLRTAPSHQIVLGRMVQCLVDREWIRDDEVQLEHMPVLLYLNRIYCRLGETLGIQRFSDEPEKRDAKMREYRSLGLERPPGDQLERPPGDQNDAG